MPKLTDSNLEQHTLATGQYGFSAAKIDSLGSTEYTLVTVVCDVSGSVSGFKDGMEKVEGSIAQACQLSPRADCLMLRVMHFNANVTEVHGFKMLEQVNSGDYIGAMRPSGCTALFDATENAISATHAYGAQLADNDYTVNAIIFVITDGDDNNSTLTKNAVKQAIEKTRKDERIESILVILIGVNIQEPMLKQYLDDFKNDADLDQFVSLDDADPKTLAKLAEFVSKSISSQSQSLGTGGPSKTLTF